MTDTVTVPPDQIFDDDMKKYMSWRKCTSTKMKGVIHKVTLERQVGNKLKLVPTEISGREIFIVGKIFDLPPPDAETDSWTFEDLVTSHNDKYPNHQISDKEKELLQQLDTKLFDGVPLATILDFNGVMYNELSKYLSNTLTEVSTYTDQETDPLGVFRIISTLNKRYDNWVQDNRSTLKKLISEACIWPVNCNKKGSITFFNSISSMLNSVPDINFTVADALTEAIGTMRNDKRPEVMMIWNQFSMSSLVSQLPEKGKEKVFDEIRKTLERCMPPEDEPDSSNLNQKNGQQSHPQPTGSIDAFYTQARPVSNIRKKTSKFQKQNQRAKFQKQNQRFQSSVEQGVKELPRGVKELPRLDDEVFDRLSSEGKRMFLEVRRNVKTAALQIDSTRKSNQTEVKKSSQPLQSEEVDFSNVQVLNTECINLLDVDDVLSMLADKTPDMNTDNFDDKTPDMNTDNFEESDSPNVSEVVQLNNILDRECKQEKGVSAEIMFSQAEIQISEAHVNGRSDFDFQHESEVKQGTENESKLDEGNTQVEEVKFQSQARDKDAEENFASPKRLSHRPKVILNVFSWIMGYRTFGAFIVTILLLISLFIPVSFTQTMESYVDIDASNSLLQGGRQKMAHMSEHVVASFLSYSSNGIFLSSSEQKELFAMVCAADNIIDEEGSLEWLLDSGASCSVCYDSSKFMSLKKCDLTVSTVKKGEVVKALGVGTIELKVRNTDGDFESLLLNNTLWIPDGRRNLLSLSHLRKMGYQTIFPPDDKMNHLSQSLPGIHNLNKQSSVIPIIPTGSLFAIRTINDGEILRSQRKQNLWLVWHRKLGFMPLGTLRYMINSAKGLDELANTSIPPNFISEDVKQGKSTNLDRPKSVSKRAESPFERVHLDIFGPMKVSSFNQHNWCAVIVDDKTRYSWVYTMRNKSDLFNVVKRFYADTAIERNKYPLCCIRRDNAGENTSNNLTQWLVDNGIRSEFSTAYEPWQDGRAEVHIRVLTNIARTNLLASGLSGRFWARAMSYATDISNLQYRHDLKMSPFQALYSEKPDVSKCQPFGIECWLYVREEQRKDKKFDARGELAVYCGRATADNKSACVCWVPSRRNFVTTNNLTFGNTYPLKKDAPDFISDETQSDKVIFPEINYTDISVQKVDNIVNFNATMYLCTMSDGTYRSADKQKFITSLLRSADDKLSQKFLDLVESHRKCEELPDQIDDWTLLSENLTQYCNNKKFIDPKNFEDAMSREDKQSWLDAFSKEMNGLVKRNVFSVVDRPTDANILGTTMIWKYKIDEVKDTVTHKCRLCLRGDRQKEGVDFFENKTYSAVLNSKENRLLCALAAANNWEIFSSDISQAFTYGELDVPLYCYPPPGFDCPTGKVFKLNYCLYGAKQAPACFKKVLVEFMFSQEFKAANEAETIFIKRKDNSVLICACFVDDILHLTNDTSMYRDFRKKFEKRFDLKSDDHVDLYLGNRIIVDHVNHTVSINQKHYIQSCLDKFGLSGCQSSDTPMSERLSTTQQPINVHEDNQSLYRAMVGSLLYLASWTRVDISFAVSELSRFVSNPGEKHITAAKRVFRYLKATMNLCLQYSHPRLAQPPMSYVAPTNVLWGYVDADWAGCPDTRKSTSGYCFMINGAAVSWRSKRQPVVALSVSEAEFISASSMLQEVVYLRNLLNNLGFPQPGATTVFADNKTCIAWSEGSVGGSERAKHIDLRIHFVHDAVKAGVVSLQKIDTSLNAADILTKPVTNANLFASLRRQLLGY